MRRVLPGVLLGALLGVLSGAGLTPLAGAQGLKNNQLEWTSDSLNLRFTYPGELVRRDPAEALKDEHLMLYGIPGGQTRELAVATHCLTPLLSLELPTSGGSITKTETKNPDGSVTVTMKPALLGTILLAELNIDCMTPAQQAMAHDLTTHMVEVLTTVPGMHAVLQPSVYLIDKQTIHMAAAQGQPISQDADAPMDPLLSYTLAFSTNWENHLLVWYFSSNNAQLMNQMTKSTVKFGNNDVATLYPPQIRMVKAKKR
jgi:hypothetical protein